MAEFVRRPDDWIKQNPGVSYMYKEYLDGQKDETSPKIIPVRIVSGAPKLRCISGVYAIICEPERHVYIGQSINVDSRLRSHKYALLSQANDSKIMREHCKKHGIDSFQFMHHSACEPVATKLLELENKVMVQFLQEGYALYNRNIGQFSLDDRVLCPKEFQPLINSLIQKIGEDSSIFDKLQEFI